MLDAAHDHLCASAGTDRPVVVPQHGLGCRHQQNGPLHRAVDPDHPAVRHGGGDHHSRHPPLSAAAAAPTGATPTPHAKPHPAPLLEAAARLKLSPEQCIYVGDDERDIAAGLAAGMGTVAATYGYLGANTAVQNWGAHAAIKFPSELLQLLASA